MKKLTALLLTLTLTLSLVGSAFAAEEEDTQIPFTPSLTSKFQDKLGFSDASGWSSSKTYIALLATLLPLDILLDESVDLDVNQYKVAQAYVGIHELGIMTAVYPGSETASALIITYTPTSKFAMMDVAQLASIPTDEDLDESMQRLYTAYYKVDAETSYAINQIFQDILSDSAR